MKKIIEFVKQYEPKADVNEIRKAYKRESRQFGIGRGSESNILQYLRLNNLIEK